MHYTFSHLVDLLARKAGMDPTSPAFADLLAIQAAVPENLFNDLKTGISSLLTTEEAKTNDNLHQHFRKLTLNGMDAELRRIMNDLQLQPEEIASLETEKNSYTRVRKLADHLHRQNQQARENAAQLQEEVSSLTTTLNHAQEEKQTQIASLQQQKEEEMLAFTIRHTLQQKEYAGSMNNKKAQALTALNLLTEELQAKQARLLRDTDGALKLVRADNNQPYCENNKEITYGDFVDRLLASHNMLKVSDPGTTGNGGNIFKNKPTGSNRTDTNGLVSANQRQIELLEKEEVQ